MNPACIIVLDLGRPERRPCEDVSEACCAFVVGSLYLGILPSSLSRIDEYQVDILLMYVGLLSLQTRPGVSSKGAL